MNAETGAVNASQARRAEQRDQRSVNTIDCIRHRRDAARGDEGQRASIIARVRAAPSQIRAASGRAAWGAPAACRKRRRDSQLPRLRDRPLNKMLRCPTRFHRAHLGPGAARLARRFRASSACAVDRGAVLAPRAAPHRPSVRFRERRLDQRRERLKNASALGEPSLGQRAIQRDEAFRAQMRGGRDRPAAAGKALRKKRLTSAAGKLIYAPRISPAHPLRQVPR